MITFSPKDPEESIVLSVNFVDLLSVGESISTATWAVERGDGYTGDSSSMLEGAVSLNASTVSQMVKGGAAGSTYIHRVKIVTSAARTLVASASQDVVRGGV